MIHKPQTYEIINYYQNIEKLIDKVKTLKSEEWREWVARKTFKGQHDSDTIVIMNSYDRDNPVFNTEIYNKKYADFFKEELTELYYLIMQNFPESESKRTMLVRLPAGKKVLPHIDIGYHLENCRRIHVPIVSDENVLFQVNGERVPMKVGSIIHINNNVLHSVDNNSSIDRIHLIIDWARKDDAFYSH